MQTVTLRNEFHKTEARVRPGRLSVSTVQRVRRQLCGMKDCACSGALGTRGPQEAAIITRGEIYYIVPG